MLNYHDVDVLLPVQKFLVDFIKMCNYTVSRMIQNVTCMNILYQLQ